MTEDDQAYSLKKVSENRHRIYHKIEEINLRIELLQSELIKHTKYPGASNHNLVDILENEIRKLIEDGYGLEIQLSKIMSHLKIIRENERSLTA